MNILNSYPYLYDPLQFTFAAFGGGLIWLCLSMTSNKWVRTSHNLINYLLIPVVAFGIVNVLANNLVLSLGMNSCATYPSNPASTIASIIAG